MAEPDTSELHGNVVANAHRTMHESLAELSRALPHMNATAEPAQTGDAPTAEPRTDATLEETPTKSKLDTADEGPESGGEKAKAEPRPTVPPTGPRGVRPPLSAAEAAERGDELGRPVDGPTPSAPPRHDVTPAPMSPTAPAETAPPSRRRP